MIRASLMKHRSQSQMFLLYGEGLLFLASGAAIYVLISRVAGIELLGKYSLVTAWMAVFQSFGNLGLSEFIMRELGRSMDRREELLTHGLIVGTGSSIGATILMISMAALVDYPAEISEALILGSLSLIPTVFSNICRAAFIAYEKVEWLMVLALIETTFILVCNAWLVLNGFGVAYLIAVVALAKLATSILSLMFVNRYTVRLRVNFDPRFARSLLPGIVAFGLSHTLGFVSRNLNVVLISFLSSVTTVGLYAAAAKLVDIVLLVIGIFAQLMLPRFASTFASLGEHDVDRYRRILHSYFSIAFIVGVGLFSFSSTIVGTVFGDEFLPSVIVLRVLTVHFLIESLDAVAGMTLKAANQQNADVRLFAFNPLVNLALGSVLIPWLGAIGAALSRLGGVCTSFALRSRLLPLIGVGTAWLRLAARPLAVCAMAAAFTSQLVNRIPPPIGMLIYAGLSAAVLVAIAPSDVVGERNGRSSSS